MPYTVTIEAGGRSSGCPQFIIILHHGQHFGRIGRFVVKRQSHLKEDAHILLPKMIIKEMVFLKTAIYLVIVTCHTHHQFFGSSTIGSRQVIIKQIVGCNKTPCDVAGSKVGCKKLSVSRGSDNQRFEKLTQLFGINFFLN